MSNKKNEYKKLRKYDNKKFFILNFLLLAFLGYATFNYLQNNTKLLESSSVFKQAVLGVSETVEDLESVDAVVYVPNSIKVLMSESSIKSRSFYTEGIERGLDEKNGFSAKIATVTKENLL